MPRGGFVSVLSAMARESARRQRQAEAEARRQARERTRAQRAAVQELRLQDKAEREQYVQSRLDEVEDLNASLSLRIEDLGSLLSNTLEVNDTIAFQSLRVRNEFRPAPAPPELSRSGRAPVRDDFLRGVKPVGFLGRLFGDEGRFQRDLAEADARYVAAKNSFEREEAARRDAMCKFELEQAARREAFIDSVAAQNKEIDLLEEDYRNGDPSGVITYNTMVLERSDYPEGFPQSFRLSYNPEAKELIVEYELPSNDVVPEFYEHKYVKSKDLIEGKRRKASERRELYKDTVSAVALRTIHEIFEADQACVVDVVVFNGFVSTVDRSTGRDIAPHLISVRASKESFLEIDLGRVDMGACLRNLGARVSPQPQSMQAVQPIVDFNMVDRRFIEQSDILSSVDARPNLMDLTPAEFEGLVGNLFQKMGLECKLTRMSRDGGVDAVAFDLRPVLGGKVVIQAKRYKNTVGVSAIRDLYGTMLNEGANKGIIVTTSCYGPDAYEFAKDKPIELIDGGGLLYLLDQIGANARIIMPKGDL